MDLANYSWLRKLFGLDPTSQLLFLNAPSSWSVFVLLGVVVVLCAGVVYFYRREINTCPHGAKRLLAGLRLAVVLLLVVIYLDPVIRSNNRRVLEPSVAVLRDASQSMDLGQDRYADSTTAATVAAAMGRTVAEVQAQPPSRVAVVNHLLSRDQQRLLQDMSQRGNVKVLDFAGSVDHVAMKVNTPVESNQPTAPPAVTPAPLPFELPPLTATGTSTDMRRAIQEALSDRLLAAIVMFTDGQHTLRETGHDDLKQVARLAGQRQVPLLIVGTGDSAKPRNLEVTDVFSDDRVWQGEPFEIKSTIRGQGIEDETIEVSLVEQSVDKDGKPEGQEKIVKSVPKKMSAGAGVIQVSFQHSVATAGKRRYTVRVPKLPGEANGDDNQAKPKLVIIGENPRVLLISGGPSWEYQHLMRLLKREKALSVTGWLQSMDLDRDQDATDKSKEIRRFPRRPEELALYDVIILLDPNPEKDFDQSWMKLLREYVGDHSGGLLFVAGPQYTRQFLSQPQTRSIQAMLPIELADEKRLEDEQILDSTSRRWQLGVVPSNADEPILKFNADGAYTQSRLQQLPGFYWSLASDGPKQGQKVLLERTDSGATSIGSPRPLLVTGMYGGRTVFVGFHGTWRWRRTPENSELYKQFWLRTIRYLVEGRTAGTGHRIDIATNQETCTPGERISITAELKTPELKPLELPKITAVLHAPSLPPENIELLPDGKLPGRYTATLVARQRGPHELAIVMPGETGTSPPHHNTEFTVVPPSVEVERSWLNKPLLVELASLSGGRYFEVSDADQLAAAIPDRKQVITVPGKTLILRDSMRVALLALLVTLLGIEWAVRKHFKLI